MTTTSLTTSASTAEPKPGEPPAGPMPRREELAFVVFSTWMILGLFLDGWAHNTDKPETFFTPWHGLLYSGFVAAMAWGALDSWRERREPRTAIAGIRLTALGAALFAIGGASDFAWHTLFGLEVGIEGLLSPTHLLLMFGGLLAASAPLRAAIATAISRDAFPTFRSFIGPLVSLTGCTALAGFFLMFVSAFDIEQHALVAANTESGASQALQVYGIASVLITNFLLLVPTLLVLRRWKPPFGAFTFLYGVVALAMTGLHSFDRALLVIPALLGGLTADVLTRREVRLTTLAMAVPAVLWSSFFVVTATAWPFAWPAELPAGTVMFAILSGLALASLSASGFAEPDVNGFESSARASELHAART